MGKGNRRKNQEEAEYTETLKKTRAREVEDYEYKKALERKKLQDQFDEIAVSKKSRTVNLKKN
jgi:colicin import membrane protein